jgi:adenosine deaminase
MEESKMDKSFYQSLPKVELHRHLEGSLRLETLLDIAQKHDLDLPIKDPGKFSALVQVQEDDPNTALNFLSKFKTLRLFFRTPEIIRRITREAIADAARDNVRYLELRFTPIALGRIGGYSLADVMDWVIESTQSASIEYGILTRLIASTNRHEATEIAAEVAQLAVERRDRGIVALDMAGDEANYPAGPFLDIFREAQQDGLELTLHAGEWAGPENVVEAIWEFGVRRIGHGVRVMEDSYAVQLARDQGVIFEVCPTSNVQSGVVQDLKMHPLPKMVEAGLNVTINTDDPGVSRIELGDEYRIACEVLKLSQTELKERVLSAANAALLPAEEREALVQSLVEEFPV